MPLFKKRITLNKRIPQSQPIVNFLIAGTQKGGTNALYGYLSSHPLLCLSRVKEPHFFDTESYFNQSSLNQTWVDYSVYHSFFESPQPHQLLGEATPIYMYWHPAAERIWAYNPAMKIILILRNPIDRAFSHWNMERDKQRESLPFGEALLKENERQLAASPLQDRNGSYCDRGFYSEQIRRLWRFFPKSQTLILKNEDLQQHPQETMATVCEFLQIDPLPPLEPQRFYPIPYVTQMTTQERDYLLHLFEYEIRGLERMLGWDCSEWLGN